MNIDFKFGADELLAAFDEAVRLYARSEGQRVFPGAAVSLTITPGTWGDGRLDLRPGVRVQIPRDSYSAPYAWDRSFPSLDALCAALNPFLAKALDATR